MSSNANRSARAWALFALAAPAAVAVLLLERQAESQSAAAPFLARGCDHRTPIGKLPYTISSSGSYYVVDDLTGVSGSHGIVVDADDVSIDLDGHTLSGVSGSLDGIHVTGGARRHLRVTGGAIAGWGGDGVDAREVAYSSWRGLRVVGNDGDGLVAGEAALVRECSFGFHDTGLRVGRGSIVVRTRAHDSSEHGFEAQGLLVECSASENEQGGFVLEGPAVARGCRTSLNEGPGIRTGSEALILEAACRQDFGAIQTGTTEGGDPCLVARCQGDALLAPFLQAGAANYLFDNTARQADFGLLLAGDHSRADSNHVTQCEVGFGTSAGASRNLLVRNSAALCSTANYDIAAGNPAGPLLPLPGPGPSWSNFDL